MSDRKPRGYWKDFANVEVELNKVIDRLGHFPSAGDLEKMRMSGLSTAIGEHGGYQTVRSQIGFGEKRNKPNGYWNDFANVEREVREVIAQIGHFPTRKELTDIKGYGLHAAIERIYGGYNPVRERLGISSPKKPHGFWVEFDNVESSLREVIGELGHFPTQDELISRKLSSLGAAVVKHGGYNAVRKRLGYESDSKPFGYWKEWSNVERELISVIEADGGKLPSGQELARRGMKGLLSGVVQHHGGIAKVRKLLEEKGLIAKDDEVERPKGFWKNLDNTLAEARRLMQEKDWGELPSYEVLRLSGNSSLGMSIARYHGGMERIRAILAGREIPSGKEDLEALLKGYIGEDQEGLKSGE